MDINRHAGEVTQELVAWVSQQLPDMRVSAISLGQNSKDASAQGGAVDAIGIDVRLIAAAPRVTPLIAGRKRAAIALDYLVTFRLAELHAEHRAMSDLAFAALAAPDIELVADYSIAEICRVNGLAPQTALLLRAEARQDHMLPHAPLVRHPPNVQLAPLAQAEGIVTGPGDIPIPGALVTLADSNLSAITGLDGRFHFAIPEGSPAQVTARAKSREVTGPLNPGPVNVFPLPMEA